MRRPFRRCPFRVRTAAVLRVLVLLSLCALLLWSCGPEAHLNCSGADPVFKVVLKLMARPLPQDIVVTVEYGGSGKEEFRLSDPRAKHEVMFCRVADDTGAPIDGSVPEATGAAGATGATDDIGAGGAGGAGGAATDPDLPAPVAALYCELYTAGYTDLLVTGSGFAPAAYPLSPKNSLCTVEAEFVLDAPQG